MVGVAGEQPYGTLPVVETGPTEAEGVGSFLRPNRKMAQKWLKVAIFQNGLKIHPKAITSFLGDVGLIKVVSEISFWHPK